MASTTAGQQHPVMIRGFDVGGGGNSNGGINPSMLLSNSSSSMEQQQQQQLLYQQSLFGMNSNTRRSSSGSSFSPTSATSAAFMIPHVGGHSWSNNAGNGGVSTEELVDGLQQSMASMDARHHHRNHHQQHHPRASSTSSTSSNQGLSNNASKPFEVPRSPTFNWHGYRPGSSSSSSHAAPPAPTSTSPFDSFHSSLPPMMPNLTRHISSPASYFGQHQSTATPSGGGATPLDVFPSPSVASTLQQLNGHLDGDASTTPSASGNFYPFATVNDGGGNSNNHTNNDMNNNNNADGRLSSFHRHQAHAQSNSYSSAFSPSSFLINGLNSPGLVNVPLPLQQQSQNSSNNTLNPTLSRSQSQSQLQSKTRSPPLYDVSLNLSAAAQESLQQGLNANNKRPGSTDSGHASISGTNNASTRGRTDSPNEDAATTTSKQQQSRGRSQGRTPASGKAPSARSSRSRTRRPSYSRNISPAGVKNKDTSSPPTATNNATTNNDSKNTGNASSSQQQQSTYTNPYAPQLSPYMPGYPSLPGGHVDQILASQPASNKTELNFQQHAYGVSAPTYSSAGFSFMKLNEQAQILAQAHALALQNQQQQQQQQKQAAQSQSNNGNSESQNSATTPIVRPASTLDILQASELNRRASDASTMGTSSLGNALPSDLMLNTAFTGPLPLPHQEGFRSSGSLPAYLSALNGGSGADGTKDGEAGDANDMEPATRGRPAADDKRRKRRESHNAVERRRRDNINDRITELAALIPEALLDTAAMQGKPSASRSRSRNGRGSAAGRGNDRDEESPDTSMQNDTMQSDTPGFPVSSVQFTPAQLAQQAAANRPNKGIILTKSVDYIRYLQQLVQMQAERNRELEVRVRMLEGGMAGMNLGHLPSAGFSLGNGNAQGAASAAGGGNNLPSTTNGLVGSPGIPLSAGGNMRSLPPLEEGENAMDEGTGLSHKRDQFTARRSTSRNSMNASDQIKQSGNNGSTTSLVGSKGGLQNRTTTTSPPELSPRQDITATQDWIDNGFADMKKSDRKNNNDPNGHHHSHHHNLSGDSASMNMMMMHDHDDGNNHQMTFEDLLRVGRNNRVVSEGRDSLASSSESPLPSIGKMEEDDDDNALGMRL